MKAVIFFSLLLCFSASAVAQDLSDHVPQENLIAEIPGLPQLGDFRVSWFVLRPPHLWVQGQAIDLGKIPWPTWDKASLPVVLSPPAGVTATLIVEDASKNVIGTQPVNKPVVFDRMTFKDDAVPYTFRVKVESNKGRLILTSKSYPWVSRKEVFKCDVELENGELINKNRQVSGCLKTIKELAAQSDRQWYAMLVWPDQKDPDAKGYVSTWDRDLRSSFRKQKHAYESDRKPKRRFSASVGVTRVELAEDIKFDSKLLSRTEKVMIPPSREVITAPFYDITASDSSRMEIVSFASDYADSRSKDAPVSLAHKVNVQFVGASGDQAFFRATEFQEARTGVAGFLRPWRANTFFTFNRLISSRGEEANFGNGPGVAVEYTWKGFDLTPYLRVESGLFHPGSTLLINELEVGAKKGFSFLPSWASVGLGYHQYQLAGKNPSSTRLGKVDAFEPGVFAAFKTDDQFIRAQFKMLVSTAMGFDSQIEFGKLLQNKTDIPYSVSIFAGFTRYAAEGTTIVRTIETFTEDRLRIGLTIGFSGPDSR